MKPKEKHYNDMTGLSECVVVVNEDLNVMLHSCEVRSLGSHVPQKVDTQPLGVVRDSIPKLVSRLPSRTLLHARIELSWNRNILE